VVVHYLTFSNAFIASWLGKATNCLSLGSQEAGKAAAPTLVADREIFSSLFKSIDYVAPSLCQYFRASASCSASRCGYISLRTTPVSSERVAGAT
jgi:hypothetical protein